MTYQRTRSPFLKVAAARGMLPWRKPLMLNFTNQG
jgi:hypothetical protein